MASFLKYKTVAACKTNKKHKDVDTVNFPLFFARCFFGVCVCVRVYSLIIFVYYVTSESLEFLQDCIKGTSSPHLPFPAP